VIRTETPPFFDALSNSVIVPGSASPTAFDFTATKSTLFSLTGAASIARNGWALNVVTTPPAALGEANGAGSLWFEFGTPLRAHWTGLARPGLLTRSVLQLAPGLIVWSAQLVSGDVTQTLRLWDEPASDPLRQASAALISIPSSTLGYVSVPGLEGVLLAGKAIRSAVYPRISTAGSLQRQSLDFGPFLQELRASSRRERKNSQSVTPPVYPSARRARDTGNLR